MVQTRSVRQGARTNDIFCLGTDGIIYYGTNELAGGAKSGGRTFQSGAGGSSAETVAEGIAAEPFIGNDRNYRRRLSERRRATDWQHRPVRDRRLPQRVTTAEKAGEGRQDLADKVALTKIGREMEGVNRQLGDIAMRRLG